MPKAPPVDRFLIHCEVAATDMGPIVAQLTKMGLANIQFELVTDIPRYARNAPHPSGITPEQLLRDWIADHPTFKANEAVKHFEANGRSKGSAYPQLANLVKAKVLKALGAGNYARADVKHLSAPKKAKVAGKTGEGFAARYAVKHADVILKLAGRRETIRQSDIKHHFEKIGRPPGSVSSALQELMRDKKLKRVGDGEYALTAAAARANGSATEVAVTEVAHG